MTTRYLLCHILLGALAPPLAVPAPAQELGGVKVSLPGHEGPAVVRAESLGKFRLRVDVDTKGKAERINVGVELPKTGANTWPDADVEVRDTAGKALLVQRSGIEWSKLLVLLPPGVTSCVVQAVEPPGGWPKPTSEKQRAIEDGASGVRVRIAPWPEGRTAALSIRFDDSHPTHLTKAVPILREYGFRGTFMINPGASEPGSRRISEFERHRAEWEAVAKQGDHEFANHSARHRGGFGDEDMESEVGEAARAIWQLTPGRSKLSALNLGGGTRWETTRTLRYYLDKYHHFDASGGSTGMDDSYGNRVENFRSILGQHIQRGLWCRIHYHYIGDGLSSTEANFRAALDIAKQHEAELWIAGMADIHKYQAERTAATLALVDSGPRRLRLKLTYGTDGTLYDQPLTIEAALPDSWSGQKGIVKDGKGAVISTTPGKTQDTEVLRFAVPPRDAEYTLDAGS